MEVILNMLEEHRGKTIQVNVGATELVHGTLINSFPEYIVVQVGPRLINRIVMMSQVRWFSLLPPRAEGDTGAS